NEVENIKFGTPVLMKNNTENAHILYISRTAPINERKIVALNVACKILENALRNSFKEADQIGLMSSSVKIRNKSFSNDGYFEAGVMTRIDNVATAAQLLNLEVEAFKISTIPSYKVQEAKDALFTEFALTMTDSMSLADVYSRDEILGLGFDYYTKYGSILSSITLSDIIESAKEYMIPDKKYVVGVSSSNSSDLVMEDKKLVFKQPKKEEVPSKEPNKDSGKDASKEGGKDGAKDSGKDAPKDGGKDNKSNNNSGKK
ncbi:MAG: insulinase family protein, partial [Candidatus Riflebacteria bacterium]|nr:insulinase family protein [Candidatus Riflebacteria bacterium]